MAVDMFLKLSNGLDGEAEDSGHAKEIDVLSYSIGATQQGSAGTGGGAGTGKVNVHDFTITKYVDRSSPGLFLACCDGTHIDTGKFTVRKAGGKTPLEFLKYEFTELIVSSIQGGASAGDDRQTETVSFNFATIKEIYTPQTATGTGGGEIMKGWDVKKNKEK